MILYSIIAGLLFGLFLALVGMGLNLIFGVMRIVNLAHGDFIMVGAMVASLTYSLFRFSPYYALLVCVIVLVLVGLPLYYLLVPRLLKSPDPEMLSIIMFFGLSQVMEAVAAFLVGPNSRSVPTVALHVHSMRILGYNFPGAWVVTAVASLIIIGLLLLYLYRTELGLLTRAIMSDRAEALASGININLVSAIAFALGLAAAGAAGIFSPFMLGSVSPSSGIGLTIQSFTIIIIGALGSPLGTLFGGVVLGLALMFMQTYLSSWANLMPYVVLVLILLTRPTGLLGRRVRNV